MVNVVIAQNRNIQVTANTQGTTLTTTSNPVTLKNETSLSSSSTSTRLDSLQDVVATSETNNSTLVYDETIDKYIVKQLDLDGGNF
tara:strand:+ start:222 stop:479 length:258 start_codon:yes stop_codon:yes gene_type:complete